MFKIGTSSSLATLPILHFSLTHRLYVLHFLVFIEYEQERWVLFHLQR